MNLSTRQILFFGSLIHLISAVFEYKDVDLWENEYPSCGGNQRSPIALDELMRDTDQNQKLIFDRYDLQPEEMTMKNNGHTVEIRPSFKSEKPVVIKDGIEYEVVQMHFHWGPSDDSGSEHVFKNKNTPLELHIVHWNSDLGEFDLEQGDGILVVGILYEIGKYGSDYLWEVVDGIANTEELESSGVKISPFSLSSVLSDSSSEYYLTYTRSLRTPPCSEGVSWIVFSEPAQVTKEQMEEIRKVEL